MKMRLTTPVAAQGAWLIAGRSAAGTVLLAITVSACTGGGSSIPSIFTPTPRPSVHASTPNPGTRTPSPTGQSSSIPKPATGSASASPGKATPHPTASAKPHDSVAPTPKPTRTLRATAPSTIPSAAPYPTAAPETGGGGTAGLQDSLLFGIGGSAILAGLGSLAYRRRLTRKRVTTDPVPRNPADREPADH